MAFGYRRIGSMLRKRLIENGDRLTVIETEDDLDDLPHAGANVKILIGNAATKQWLACARMGKASLLFVAIPQSFEAGQIIEKARVINPGLKIVARAHSDVEGRHLKSCGANLTIMGEREIARRMIDYAQAG